MTAAGFAAECHLIESPDARTARRINASDRLHVAQVERYVNNVCDETFTDRQAFTDHMRQAHGYTLGRAKSTTPAVPRRFAPFKIVPFDPGPFDPGAWVTWTESGITRTGQVWSSEGTRDRVVIPVDATAERPYVTVSTSTLTPLGHAVPRGLFGDDGPELEPDAHVKLEPGPDRTFPDAAAVRAHWAAGADEPHKGLARLALVPLKAITVSGALAVIPETRGKGFQIVHIGTGKALHGAGVWASKPKTRTAAVAAMHHLNRLPVAWGASGPDVVDAVRHTLKEDIMRKIVSGTATEVEIDEQATKPATTTTRPRTRTTKAAPVKTAKPTTTPTPTTTTRPTAKPKAAPVKAAPMPSTPPAVPDAPRGPVMVTGWAAPGSVCARCHTVHRKPAVTATVDGQPAVLGLACVIDLTGRDGAAIKADARAATAVAAQAPDEVTARRSRRKTA